MADNDNLNQLRQTCNGIRRVYDGRLEIISSLEDELEAVIEEWQHRLRVAYPAVEAGRLG